MYKRVLLALDLEGVNNVVGEPYMGLSKDTEQWEIARRQAALEVNAAADALFSAGVEKVGLWDNHGARRNLDPADLDPRILLLSEELCALPRLSFLAGEYDCVCFFGYHAMEGTLGGVLAHTMNSKIVQFYKINGRYVGEVDIDAYITASHGLPCRFFAGGDVACRQASRSIPHLVTVVTKTELGRNRAIFRSNEELLSEIGREIVKAVSAEGEVRTLAFPATLEKSFKRVEDAEIYLQRLKSYDIDADYPDDEILGKDGHTVVARLRNAQDLVKCF